MNKCIFNLYYIAEFAVTLSPNKWSISNHENLTLAGSHYKILISLKNNYNDPQSWFQNYNYKKNPAKMVVDHTAQGNTSKEDLVCQMYVKDWLIVVCLMYRVRYFAINYFFIIFGGSQQKSIISKSKAQTIWSCYRCKVMTLVPKDKNI